MKLIHETRVTVECETCPETVAITFKAAPWIITRPHVVVALTRQGWTKGGRCPECKGTRRR